MTEHPGASGSRGTRLALAITLGLLATMLVLAARSPASPDTVRHGRKVELIELIRAQEERTAALAVRVEELTAEVARLEASGDGQTLARLHATVEQAAGQAGLTGIRGPGLVAELRDAPSSPPGTDPNNYVIHEEDLQAVVNALWAGGAEAVTVNGERILATTAIRCVGNTLLLHGRTHSPPYVLAAIGDRVTLRDALQRDPGVGRFAAAASQFGLGFDVTDHDTIELPAYEGVASLRVARPATVETSQS